MKFKQKTMSQSQLGELFGASSHDIGRWLIEVGLRDPKTKKPSWDAYHCGFCTQAPCGLGFSNLEWVSDVTVAKLREAGHDLLSTPPESLVEMPFINGPFCLSGHEVVNADGTLAARTTSADNADFLMRLLNTAYKAGVVKAPASAC